MSRLLPILVLILFACDDPVEDDSVAPTTAPAAVETGPSRADLVAMTDQRVDPQTLAEALGAPVVETRRFAAMALAAGFGIGVMFSALTVLILQGGLTLAGGALAQYTSDLVIGEMSATGGILILGIGLYLLDIKKLPLANLLPALAFIVPLTLIFG